MGIKKLKIHYQTLMIGIEMVPETWVIFNQLIRLTIREDFILRRLPHSLTLIGCMKCCRLAICQLTNPIISSALLSIVEPIISFKKLQNLTKQK
jgi:hypothetical protein